MLMIPGDSMLATIKALLDGPWTARELATELGRPLRTTQAWLESLDHLGCPMERVSAHVPTYRLRRGELIDWLMKR